MSLNGNQVNYRTDGVACIVYGVFWTLVQTSICPVLSALSVLLVLLGTHACSSSKFCKLTKNNSTKRKPTDCHNFGGILIKNYWACQKTSYRPQTLFELSQTKLTTLITPLKEHQLWNEVSKDFQRCQFCLPWILFGKRLRSVCSKELNQV